MAATGVKPNSYHGALCAPRLRLLPAPDVSTEIGTFTFGEQSNEPGIDPEWRPGLDLLGLRKGPAQSPTFDFAPQEGNRLIAFHAGARRVVRPLPPVASNCRRCGEDRHDGEEDSKEAIHPRAEACPVVLVRPRSAEGAERRVQRLRSWTRSGGPPRRGQSTAGGTTPERDCGKSAAPFVAIPDCVRG